MFLTIMNNVVSILNRAYVKKTNDINKVNRFRSHTDDDKDMTRELYGYHAKGRIRRNFGRLPSLVMTKIPGHGFCETQLI